MKHIVKLMSIILTVLMLLSVVVIAPITADAMGGNGSNDVLFNPGIAKSEKGCWFAWTWGSNVKSYWARGLKNDDGTITFWGLEDKVIFALLTEDPGDDMVMDSWDYAAIYQSDDLSVDGDIFEATKWTDYNSEWDSDNFNGEWSKEGETKPAEVEPEQTTAAPTEEYVETEPEQTTAAPTEEYVETEPEQTTAAPTEEYVETEPETAAPTEEETEDTEPEEPTEKEPNSLEVYTSTKSVKAYKLKKAAVTVKPLRIEDYDGKLTITKVKDGSSSYLYSKITVNKSSGAIKIKKGTTKVGTYKIKLKLHATGDEDFKPITTTKTVTIKILGKSKNTLSVSIKSNGFKDFKSGALKKAKKSFSLISVKKAKGSVKVTKVKKGTSSAIYKKITIKKKSGKITLKKGNYKNGVYKIQLKVKAKGNKDYKSKSITKTVEVRIAKKFKNCSKCKGKGKTTCTNCNGTGYLYARYTITLFMYGMPYRTFRPRFTCSVCHGKGKMDCDHCHSTGKVV